MSQNAKGYGAFDAYVIRYVGNIADQLLRTAELPYFLARLNTYSAFLHVLARGHWELHSLKDEDAVPRDNSIWTVSNINAYTKAKMKGDLAIHVLPAGHLVSSSMRQNHALGFAAQHLPSKSDFMGDSEPNVCISNISSPHSFIRLVPDDNVWFSIVRFHRE